MDQQQILVDQQKLPPGVYAVLPPGWYWYTSDDEEDMAAYENMINTELVPDAAVLLGVRKSEMNTSYHRAMCEYWSVHEDHYYEYARDFIGYFADDCEDEDENDAAELVALNEAAECLPMLDDLMRDIFGEKVFSTCRYDRMYMRHGLDIEELNEYYAQNNMINPHVYSKIVKLPPGFDVTKIIYFCQIIYV
jgi:hypothetical protein